MKVLLLSLLMAGIVFTTDGAIPGDVPPENFSEGGERIEEVLPSENPAEPDDDIASPGNQTDTDAETPKSDNEGESSNQQYNRTVYITKTGKRYHYSSTCNGGTYYPSTLSEALARGLTPCEKCVH